tara:strand:+ start:757 stop:999 length:243 start_codon:yes stop_codon:yes gene_type:complete
MDMSKLSPEESQQIVQKMEQEVAGQQLQTTIQSITSLCFKKCAGTSGEKLESREQQCSALCMDRYMDAMQVVVNSMQKKM